MATKPARISVRDTDQQAAVIKQGRCEWTMAGVGRLEDPHCGLHAFRHAHTSLLLDTGATPKVVQEQLRHADPRVTLDVYGHVLGDARRNAVEKVASVVFQNVSKTLEQGGYIQ
jgi:integrase